MEDITPVGTKNESVESLEKEYFQELSGKEEDNKMEFQLEQALETAHVPEKKGRIRYLVFPSRAVIYNIIVMGIGVFVEGYNLSVVNLINVLFTKEYKSAYSSSMKTHVGNASLIGAIFGMLFFGSLSDRIGRKSGLLVTASILIIAPALSAGAYGANGSITGMLWALIIYRGLLGFGIGGEYPCGASVMSEATEETNFKRRGRNLLLIFALWNVGNVCSVVYIIILLAIFGTKTDQLEPTWRIAFGSALIPVIPVFIYRFRMRDSNLYRVSSLHGRVPILFVIKKYWKYLIGTAGSWFVFDIVAYSNGIYSATIISQVTSSSDVMKVACYTLILTGLSAPGQFVTPFLVDRIGRKRLQIFGFSAMCFFGALIGGLYPYLKQTVPAFITLYVMLSFMINIGPGDTTYLIPAEIYPTPIRATCHGISAAFGKTGAALGTEFLLPIEKAFGGAKSINGPRAVFLVNAGIALIGILITVLFVPDMSHKQLTYVDQKFYEALIDAGYHLEFSADGRIERLTKGSKKVDSSCENQDKVCDTIDVLH